VKIGLGAQFNVLSSYVPHALILQYKQLHCNQLIPRFGCITALPLFREAMAVRTYSCPQLFVVAVVAVVNHFEMSIIKL
jgi:hypothetical protein